MAYKQVLGRGNYSKTGHGLPSALKQMIGSRKHTIEYMEKTLKNIAGDYYDYLDNPLLRLEVENWEKTEAESSERNYKDQRRNQ